MLFDVTCNFEAVPRDYVPCYKCMSHAMSYQTRVFPFGRGRVYLVNERSQRHNSYSAVLSLRDNISSICRRCSWFEHWGRHHSRTFVTVREGPVTEGEGLL